MTVEYEEIDLPVFCRQVAVTHGAGEGEPPHTVRRILDRFSGVLGVGVTVGNWPPPALSYLTLDRLAAAALADSEGGRRPASKETRSTVDTDTGTDTNTAEGESEPRVREVIRDDSSSAGETSPRPDPPRIAALGRLATDESGIVVDPPSADETVGTREPFQGNLDRSPADDRHVMTSLSPIEGHSTGQTEHRERSVRREVVQPEEIRRRRVDESSADPDVDRPGTDDERGTGSRTRRQPGESGSSAESSETVGERITEETVERESGRNPGDGDRSGDRPLVVGSDDDPRGPGPARAPPTVTGPSARRWGPPAMTVSRAAPRVLTTRPDRPDSVPESSRSRPREGRDRMKGGATGFERSPRDDAPSLARSDPKAPDPGVPMEPLETPTRAPGTTGSGGAEPSPTTAGTGDGRVDSGDGRYPRMTVHRNEGSSGVTGGDDAGGDRSAGRTDATDADGSQTGHSSRGNADREGTSEPQRIDDLLDVDRLVDRLMRAFERKARIERERRGR